MCMESPLVILLRRLSKQDYDNIIECLALGIADGSKSDKTETFKETLSKMQSILTEYEKHEI